MSIRLAPQVPASHGGLGGAGIDLSVSLNPLGPSPAALAAARAAELGSYPDVDAKSLREAAAERHGIPVDAVVPVPGASWGLWLCGLALLAPGDRCVALAPCYSEYRRCAEIARAECWEVAAGPPHWLPDDGALATALARRPAVCFICNPANPTGALLPKSRLHRLFEIHPETTFVVDEAFSDFAPSGASLLEGGLPPRNVVVVRSLTKALGLPGLRMGYLVGSAELAGALSGILPPWPLSSPALAAAVAGLQDRGHVESGAEVARRHLGLLAAALAGAGAKPFPSSANYLMACAPGMAAQLSRHGVVVRDCASLGLPDHIRVAAPRVDELDVVLAAIRSDQVLLR
ncbi:MAG: pyridoxal phosphate-dependent aminotransferase [Candidatus Dormibacteria bacterium]